MAIAPKPAPLSRRHFLVGTSASAIAGGFGHGLLPDAAFGQELTASRAKPPGGAGGQGVGAGSASEQFRPQQVRSAVQSALRRGSSRRHRALPQCGGCGVRHQLVPGTSLSAHRAVRRALLCGLLDAQARPDDQSPADARRRVQQRQRARRRRHAQSALYALLEQHDLAITHGRCPTVGAAGFLLGGGIGFNMRADGARLRRLTASEIVTADGKIRTIGARRARTRAICSGPVAAAAAAISASTRRSPCRHSRPSRVTVFDITWTRQTRVPARSRSSCRRSRTRRAGSARACR